MDREQGGLDDADRIARVLLVEDEFLIALMAQEMLLELGYDVVVAHDVSAALAAISSGGIDLAILDVNLSGATSEPVAAALAVEGRPFLFVTGYGIQGVPAAYRSQAVLPKPYDQQSLDRAIRAVRSG